MYTYRHTLSLLAALPIYLNVLDSHRTPGVMGLKLLLQEWVYSQIDILLRRTRHRMDKIASRLELVEGYIIAYLNLDRSEEHTSELQSLLRSPYAVFCLTKKNTHIIDYISRSFE